MIDEAAQIVFERPVSRLLDVGGNTGKWAILCARRDPNVRVTILDLPGQLERARHAISEACLTDRIDLVDIDLLDHQRPFPAGFDAVWMSQFLDCFGESDASALLGRGRAALSAKGRLFVLEPFWDRQPNPIGAYSLRAASLYFTCMANGQSRFFGSDDLRGIVAGAGLKIEREADGLGVGHTLFVCVAR